MPSSGKALNFRKERKMASNLETATENDNTSTKSKRTHDDVRTKEDDDDDESWIGPMPSEAAKSKKRKVLEFEQIYLNNLPSSEMYEKSYMHRDVISHLIVTKSNFLVTASTDGHVKFWKKNEDEGIEFVKHFRSHLGAILDLAGSVEGLLCCTVSDDRNLKVFEVVFADMINMIRLSFSPAGCSWVYAPGDAISAIAVTEKATGKIYLFDGRGESEPLRVLDKLHSQPVVIIKYNPVYHVAVSVDTSGMLEYWCGPSRDCKFPKNILWQYKTDTDLYEFAKNKIVPTGIAFSPNGKFFATLSTDRKVRIFKFLTGKISKVLDESLQHFSELQQTQQQLPNMEFGRRVAVERDLEKSEFYKLCNILFDESGNFILYATMLGIKVVNLFTNTCSRELGKPENARFLHLGLFQGTAKEQKAAVTVEMEASENPALKPAELDPTLFCTAYKKNRFYMFSKRGPDDLAGNAERDIFNEKPTKEEMVAATQDASYSRISDSAILHTTMGDIHIQLFANECPKTVENFCVHSKNAYFNGHIFHRVIKGFMVQTGDPLGNGTGGESIWGDEFEDEFVASLRHDRPYTVSMANAGPNTNGSQFFITVAPTPWLDNKHTVFGRVVRGMEVVQNVSNVKTNPKTDKPYDDIRIVSVSVK